MAFATALMSATIAAGRYSARGDDGKQADIDDRKATVAASLEVHAALNEINGEPGHNLGTALRGARHKLPGRTARAVRRLQRQAGAAKHDWAPAHDWAAQDGNKEG